MVAWVTVLLSSRPSPGMDDRWFCKIVSKIRSLLPSWRSQNVRMLKCRTIREVRGFLPPPGGPSATRKLMSTRFLKAPITFLSYQPGWKRC